MAGRRSGFTLLELSVVLALIALITAGGLVTLSANMQASQFNLSVARMDAIEKALLDFATVNNRIPCPASLTLTTSSSSYGYEAGTSAGGTGTGECQTGMTPSANFKSTSGTEEGAVPVRTLRLPDEYMYDGWGRRFRFAVDPAYTLTSSLPAGTACSLSPSANTKAITVNDASGSARTTRAAYALLSHGANGHGAYAGSGVIVNSSVTSTDELTDCHCTSAGVAGTYAPTYVQKTPAYDAAHENASAYFYDDIVAYKEAWQLQAATYALSTATCTQYIYVADYSNNRVQKFDTSGTYISQFGSTGSGNGQFQGPEDIAFDSAGNMYIPDCNNNRVQKFDSSGVYISKFGSSGSGNGQFSCPSGIAIDSSSNIWVVDQANARVQKFDSSGTYQTKFGSSGSGNGQFNQPTNIRIDGSGNLWVGDALNDRVQKFNSSGVYQSKIGTTGSGDGQFSYSGRLAFDSSYNIYIPDRSNYRIQKFDSSGTFLGKFGSSGSGNGQFGASTALFVDSNGNLWVTDKDNSRVQKFNSSFVYQSKFGSSGSGNGQFSWPNAIVIH